MDKDYSSSTKPVHIGFRDKHNKDCTKVRSGFSCFCCGDDDERKSNNMNDTTIVIGKEKKSHAVKRCVGSFTVCLGLISYTFLGAILFVVIEGDGFLNKGKHDTELLTTNFGSEPRERAVENIWEITVNLNILYRENWTKLASQEISKFQDKIIEHLTKELNHNKEVTTSTDTNWDLARSLLYSITILTTTGYGKMGPKTMLGKTVTMVYAAIGIPLMLIYLSSVGNLLSNCTLSIFNGSFCCSCNRRRKKENNKEKEKSGAERLNLEPFYIRSPSKAITPDRPSTPRNHNCPDALHKTSSLTVNHFGGHSNSMMFDPIKSSGCYKSTFMSICLCLAVMIAYVCCGASILCVLERNWSYLDGIFFCFMTLSTINFVDTVPSKLQTYGDMTVWFFSLYILSGMALTAMCFNIFHKEVVYRLEAYSAPPPPPMTKSDLSKPSVS